MFNRWNLRIARMLKKEIIMALILKAILLSLLWSLCFHDPIEKHLTKQSIKRHWFSVQK
jgi:hypothetical protein